MHILDILITVAAILILIVVWVVLIDLNRYVIRRHKIVDRRLQRAFKAIVIADLHNKSYGKENAPLLETIRKEAPDCIFIAGDMPVACSEKDIDHAVAFLEQLAKEYPIYYGNGNHESKLKLFKERFGDLGEKYAAALQRIGIEPIVNTGVTARDFGFTIYGAEIGMEYYKRFASVTMDNSYMETLLGKPDANTYTILLAHNPAFFEQYADWGADLVLSGHVHGGVARVPFWGKGVIAPSFRLFPKYDGGVFESGNSTMIVSRGLGTHSIHIRFNNPGELWVVEFTPEENA